MTATDPTPVTGGTSAPSSVSAGVVPTPPANTGLPSISGVVQQGQTLTANPGTWTGTVPITYTYAWTSGGTAVGTNSATYLAAPTDVGKTITVSVSASNAGGIAGPANSAPSAAVLPLPPTNVTPPTISGTPQQGQVLTVTPGAWTNSPTSLLYQWQDCNPLACTPIPGQTKTSYTVGAGRCRQHDPGGRDRDQRRGSVRSHRHVRPHGDRVHYQHHLGRRLHAERSDDQSERHADRDGDLKLAERQSTRLGDLL